MKHIFSTVYHKWTISAIPFIAIYLSLHFYVVFNNFFLNKAFEVKGGGVRLGMFYAYEFEQRPKKLRRQSRPEEGYFIII